VIVRTRNGANLESRDITSAWGLPYGAVPTASQYGSWVSTSGQRISPEIAAGVPAALNAVWLIAESVATLPLRVYRGRDAAKRAQDTSWQWRLLHDQPNDEQSAFDFWFDVASAIETAGNAFVRKIKAPSGQVAGLYLIGRGKVAVRRNGDGEKVFVIRGVRGASRSESGALELTATEVLHFRGPTLGGGDVGLTPLQLARHMLGAEVSRHEYEGEFLRNDATPPTIIEHPDSLTRTQAREFMASWIAARKSAPGAPGLLAGGAKMTTYGLTLKDAQFVDSRRLGVEDVSRIFRMPPSMLGAAEQGDIEQETTRFLSFGLNPRMSRIQGALLADPDFGFDSSGGLYPEFFADEFIRVDAATKAQVRHWDVQSGVLLPDEARADVGREPLPPLPDDPAKEPGKVPQVTPVGGAPNPALIGSTNGASAK
jgi:HK97 family phage portal protein